MDFHWDDIRFFLEIYRAGSLTAASKRLGVSHTTVARHAARLENSLNVSLFVKDENGYQLSEAGLNLLASAQSMERAGNQLAENISSQSGALVGRVRIGAPDGIGNSFLSHILPNLQKKYPLLEIEFVPIPATHKLWKRDIDIAISLDRPETGRIVMRKLVDYDLRLYGSKKFLDDNFYPNNIEELLKMRFVGYINTLLYTNELDFLGSIHEDLKATYRSATVKGQYDAIVEGAGLGILPSFMVKKGDLVPLMTDKIKFSRTYWLLVPEDTRHHKRIKAVSDYIFNAVRESASSFLYD